MAKIKIRKTSDEDYYKNIHIADVDSKFLQCIFQLDFSPMYLRSDDQKKELVPIKQNDKLKAHESYVIEHHSFFDQKNEIRLAASLTIAAEAAEEAQGSDLYNMVFDSQHYNRKPKTAQHFFGVATGA